MSEMCEITELDQRWCEHCLHPPERKLALSPKEWEKQQEKVRKAREKAESRKRPPLPIRPDPVVRRIAQIYSGLRCPDCGELRDEHGFCQNQRIVRYREERKQIAEWALDVSAEGHAKAAVFPAIAGLRRAALRAGRDLQAEICGEEVPLIARASFDARDLFDQELRWRPHRERPGDELPL